MSLAKLSSLASFRKYASAFFYRHDEARFGRNQGLKETPAGAITTILRNVDDGEMQRILHFTAIVLKPNLIKPCLLNDSPKEIYENPCYSVVFDFHPFDRSKSLVAGYFQLMQTAKTVTEFILQAHFQKRVGFGFDTTIEKIHGKFVRYTSGKCYIKVDEKHHEILPTCNYLEFDRIFKELNEAISKWSHYKK